MMSRATSSYSRRGRRGRSRSWRTGVVGRALLPSSWPTTSRRRLAHRACNPTRHPLGRGRRESSADDVARHRGRRVVYCPFLLGSVTSSGRTGGRGEPPRRPASWRVCSRSSIRRTGDDDPTASPHLRSRRETGNALRRSGSSHDTRAAMIVGKGAQPSRRSSLRRPPAGDDHSSWVSTPTQPIASLT
jgi:hypothetical protein